MSEIRDPAQPESPTAPGDEGETTAGNERTPGNERPAAPASVHAHEQHDHEDEPSPGNQVAPGNTRAPAPASHDDEDEGDNIGNVVGGNARLTPAGAGAPEASEPEALASGAASEDEGSEDSAEDSIGNRLDRPPTHTGSAGGHALQQGAGGQGKNKRKKGKGGGGAHAHGGAPQGQKGGGDSAAQHRAFHVGDKVRAKIVSLGAAGAMVDLWGKEHGVLDLREVETPEGPAPQVGDGVDVIVVQDGARGGNLVVTRDPSRAERAREAVAQAFNTNEPIEGLVTGINRGGLEVDLSGVRAFCPSSQIDARFPPTVSPKQLVLTRQLFKITSLVDDGKEAIVSRRSILEKDVRARAEEALANIKVGAVVKGIVVSVKDYGVFVDLGGVEGLIHISELTHNRSARPQDVVKVGEEVEAKVLRISSGQKPAQGAEAKAEGAPAEGAAHEAEAHEAHAEGEAHEGEGHEAQAEGEAHEGEGHEAQAEGATAEGAAPAPQAGKGKGRDKDKKQRRGGRGVEGLPRVMLSRRAVEPDPWSGFEKRFPVGSVHTGKVARMQPFGAFIELTPGVDGLLHVSELGGTKRIEHPNEVLKEAQTVTVRVERIDRGAKRISLSLLPDGVTAEQLKSAVVPRVGMVVKGTVAEHESGGFWVQIDGAIGKAGRGFVPDRESNQPRGTDLRKVVPVGASVQVKVVEIDRGRLKLSIRAALHDEERQAYRAYQKEANATRVGVSLADKLRGKLGGLGGSEKR